MTAIYNTRNEDILKYVLNFFPRALFDEITRTCNIGGKKVITVNEIRLRLCAPCSIVVGGNILPLYTRLSSDDIDKVYMKICKDTPFALREYIINGYVPLEYGVRVGVGGEARYESGAIVGVSGISVLVFRLPGIECAFGDELYREWEKNGLGNMLVCSPPAVGKTTVLRTLVRLLSRDRRDKNIVVVDERCEFYSRDYLDCNVDILSGYKRQRGLDIAIRTMSAHYVVVDEIGRMDECEAVVSAYGCGVGILASAHGESLEEIKRRECLRELMRIGVFSLVAIVSRHENNYSYRIYKV